MRALCQASGHSRQAYYQRLREMMQQELDEQALLDEVRTIRARQPRVGTRKLQRMVNKRLQGSGIVVGRDRLFNLLRTHDLLIRRRRSARRTTWSRHHFYTYRNLLGAAELTGPNQGYVADLTYVDTLEGFCYLALLTDAWSRKIVGYDLSQSLSLEGSLRALEMALRQLHGPIQLIHHSDRGIQYCSHAYVGLLIKHGIRVSMTEQNHVYENAKAERVNGILKTEFLLGDKLSSFAVAKELVQQSIHIYNYERLHMSLDYQTPAMRHAA